MSRGGTYGPGARGMRRAGLLVALGLLVAGCSGRTGGAAGAHGSAVRRLVVIHAVHFDPEVLAVAVGDTVEWRNRDLVPHTATAVDGAWDSGNLAPDSSWSTVIRRPGGHAYGCRYHPIMKGEIQAK